QVLSQLPQPVQRNGVSASASSPNTLRVYGVSSPDGRYDDLFVANYVQQYMLDPLKQIDGVGDVQNYGKPSAVRIWLDLDQLALHDLTVLDVKNAINSQTLSISGGAIGQAPAPPGQEYTLPLELNTQLDSLDGFANLVLKALPDGGFVRVQDVARVEWGAETYNFSPSFEGKPGAAIAISQSPGSNALRTAQAIDQVMAQLEQAFPPGLVAQLDFDSTQFIKISAEEIILTLAEAITLVILVIFIFLQDWRTTIITAIALPVSLIGSLLFTYLLGFSLNTLTMFGLILATGLVVDDAIVVVEALVTKIDQGLSPPAAAAAAMEELAGAIIATSLVLMVIFVPVIFTPGVTGRLYEQFALIIVFAILVSAFVALSFSPSVAAILLRPRQTGGRVERLFRPFNQGVDGVIERYLSLVRFLLRWRYLVMIGFVVGLVGTYQLFKLVPAGFVPQEDTGNFMIIVQGPAGTSSQETQTLIKQIETLLNQEPDIDTYAGITGIGPTDGLQANQGMFFTRLKPWEERKRPDQSVEAITNRLNSEFAKQGLMDPPVGHLAIAINPPAVGGFGNQGGYTVSLQDESGGSLKLDALIENSQNVTGVIQSKPAITSVDPGSSGSAPGLSIDFNRTQMDILNVDFQQAAETLSAAIGGTYVTDAVINGTSYDVYLQADARFRSSPEDIGNLTVAGRTNQLVPLGSLIDVRSSEQPEQILHYDTRRAVSLTVHGNEEQFSSGQVLSETEAAIQAAKLPQVGYAWTGLAKLQITAGNRGALIFGLGIAMVFLALASQYESFVDPLIILLTVPLALLGAIAFLMVGGLSHNVYANISFLMLIGLASKNGILIVEYANQLRAQGLSVSNAVLKSVRLRFRPIIMTAISALVGFFPLVIATGAGAVARHSVGYPLFGGLLVATILSLLVLPILYIVIKNVQTAISKSISS
ncbi:MAG: efflux RND transporter permease subunit, partial [Cyanobacteria bacterium P01_H01_bin.15]